MGYFVYKHTSPSNKVYIGITKQLPTRRWRNGKSYSNNIYFTNAIKKYGWDNFEHTILFSNLTEEEAKIKEIESIAFYNSTNPNNGYNITLGGESGNGYHHTDDTKKRISSSEKGRVSPMKGRKHSEETKNKISKSNKGVVRRKGFVLSDETKLKISLGNKGIKKPKSKAHKDKLRQKRLGRTASSETKLKQSIAIKEFYRNNGVAVLQYNLDGNFIKRYRNSAEAIEELGVKQTTFSLHLNNGKPLNNYIFKKERNLEC